MADLSHHDVEDGFHEIQLSGKQLVFLFMATTVVSVVIFLCGVLVGRGVKADRLVDLAEPIAGAASPQATAAAPTDSPSADPPPPAADAALTYPQRLEATAPPSDKLRPRTGLAASVPAGTSAHQEPPDAVSDRQADPPAVTASAAADAPKAPAPKPVRSEPARPVTASAAAAAAPMPTATSGRPGVWVVQLVALKDRGAASSIVKRLTGKGFPAFIVSPSPGSPSIFRVQVGRYDDRQEAEQVARRLEKEEQFKPWISH